MIIVKENVPEETIFSPDGSKKLIEYGEIDDPNLNPSNFYNPLNDRGKLTADFMKVTIFDKNGNIISIKVEKNKFQDKVKFSSIIRERREKNPDKML